MQFHYGTGPGGGSSKNPGMLLLLSTHQSINTHLWLREGLIGVFVLPSHKREEELYYLTHVSHVLDQVEGIEMRA